MPKETFYFPHDYTAGNNPKIMAMLSNYGATGYGTYWYIIELLHQNDEHKLPMKEYIFEAIAKQMSTNAKQVLEFITNCIQKYDLFYESGGFFSSDRVQKNMEKRNEISEKRSLSGKIGGLKRLENQANAKQTEANAKQNQAKEKKGNKSKEKESKEKEFVPPLLGEVIEYFSTNGYSEQSATTAFNYYAAADWVDSKGNNVKSWKQKMISVWFKPDNKQPATVMPMRKEPIDHRKNAEGWK
jgi:hypothetical protein